MKVNLQRLRPDAILPSYHYPGDAGLAMHALEDKELKPGERYRFDVGWALEFADKYVAVVLDRGSMAQKGLKTMGGVFDANYRGEYNVGLINLSSESYEVKKGDKIAQLVLISIGRADFKEVNELSATERGQKRFGSSGR